MEISDNMKKIDRTLKFAKLLEDNVKAERDTCAKNNPNIYILNFPDFKVIKIGKTNNIYKRVFNLSSSWGVPDYSKSYIASIEKRYIYKLEKAVHLFLSKYLSNIVEGRGHTELFDDEANDLAIELIQWFLDINSPSVELVRLDCLDTKLLRNNSQDLL